MAAGSDGDADDLRNSMKMNEDDDTYGIFNVQTTRIMALYGPI